VRGRGIGLASLRQDKRAVPPRSEPIPDNRPAGPKWGRPFALHHLPRRVRCLAPSPPCTSSGSSSARPA
jgi:hypothetical protein